MVSEMWGLTVSIFGQIKRTSNVCYSVIIKHRQTFDRRALLLTNEILLKYCEMRANFDCQANSSDLATRENNAGQKKSNDCPPCNAVTYERFLVAKKHRYM